jgi:alkanesulfonate monooxygenase SsuD/methylene tetrahydromethanopterin reductase-like flavin-dependent oxidoreductase (luciferase family)
MNRPRRRVGLDVKHEGREPRLTTGDMLARARLAEQLGFDSFWTNGFTDVVGGVPGTFSFAAWARPAPDR